MSRVEEGSLFVNRFSRVALALSAVTSSFVLANTGVVAGVNAGGTHVTEGETNSSIGMGVSELNTTVVIDSAISGAIVAGDTLDVTTGTGDSTVISRSFLDANGSTGTAMGLDINSTSVLNITNTQSGSINAIASTLSSYDPHSVNTNDIRYPDVNNTELFAVGISATNAITSLTNDGDLSVSGVLNNNTKNSLVDTAGIVLKGLAATVTNTGNILSDVKTQASYVNSNGAEEFTVRPDLNNTSLHANGLDLTGAVAVVSNTGTIATSAVLNNDTNNSTADATAVSLVGVIGSFTNDNGGNIIATAETHEKIYDENGTFVENRLIARIGGHTGISGEIDTKNIGDKVHYTSSLHDGTNLGTDSKVFQADTSIYDENSLNAHDNGKKHGNNSIDSFNILNAENYIRTDNGIDGNSHIHTEDYSAFQRTTKTDNIISAEGVHIKGGVTPDGFTNHEYISSLKIDAAIAGAIDGILVSPNGGLPAANTDGIDENATEPTEDELAQLKEDGEADLVANLENDGAEGNKGGAVYGTPSSDNGKLTDSTDNNYSNQAAADAEASFKAQIAAIGDAPDPDDYADVDAGNLAKDNYNASLATVRADQNATAVKEDIAKAYLKSPEAPGSSDANTSTSTPTLSAPAGTPKEGIEVARIGNTVNNGAVVGTIHGVLLRASTGTNLSDEINATTGELLAGNGEDGNRNINANVTSASYSAYLGEGVDENGNSRIITKNVATDRLTNDLIGGLKNNFTINGGAGGAAFTLTSDATALAISLNDIDINQTSTTDENGSNRNYEDIVSNPTSIVGVGVLENSSATTAMTGALGSSGLEVLATATGGISTLGTLTGKELVVSPTAITNIREMINHGNILGGLGASAVNGAAKATGAILVGDINATKGTDATQQTGVVVRTHADATMGNFFNSGTITQALGLDALKMTSSGSSTLLTGGVTDSKVDIYTTSNGGIQKVYGKDGNKSKLTEGNFLNAGMVTAALSLNAINMQVSGIATATVDSLENSDVNITNISKAGTEGSFGNVAWAGTNEETLDKSSLAKRGLITSSLALDAVHLTGSGLATLLPSSINGGNTSVTNVSIGGVGEHFVNYGLISSSLALNAVNLSGISTTLLSAPSITAGTTSVTNITKTGTGGDFINGASAIEIGALHEGNITVHNPVYDYTDDEISNPTLIKDHDGYYTVAANINDNNSSDTNSSGARPNNVENIAGRTTSSDAFNNQLTQEVVHSYDKEGVVLPSAITSSLALDAINFTSVGTGTFGSTSIQASLESRIDREDNITDPSDDTNHDVFKERAIVSSLSSVDASIGGDFVNNGVITSSLALNAVNGVSTGIGSLIMLGDVESSTISQETYSRAGVQGDFLNEAVSREVGSAELFTTRKGNREVGAIAYNRLVTTPAAITASLALNAITLESHGLNTLTLINTQAANAVADTHGSGVTREIGEDSGVIAQDENLRNITTFKDAAGSTRSNVTNRTTSISGVGGDFSNTGLITSSLALNAVDAKADGINTILATNIKGTNVSNSLTSIAGVQGNFDNDVQSLKVGTLTKIYKDVYDINGTNVRVDPKYYDNEDAKEGERVKSNVVDRVVYDRIHLAPLITASLALDAINVDATNIAHTNLAVNTGVTEVEVVTNHTGYDASENPSNGVIDDNKTLVDRVNINPTDRIIKVTSEDVTSTSTIIAGIGGKFTNRGLISSSLALNAVSAGTSNILSGLGGTEIEGGNVAHNTFVIGGFGNDNNKSNEAGFLNAAGTYDIGSVHVEHSTVTAHDNGKNHLLAADNGDRVANDAYFDGNETHARDRRLTLVDSEDVVFWNKDPLAIPGTMTASLALDVVKANSLNVVNGISTGTIKAVTGEVNTTIGQDENGDNIYEQVNVVGQHVEGTARATVNYDSQVIGGVNGGFTNQGLMTSSLALNVLDAFAAGTAGVSSDVEGSTVTQKTLTIAGVQGDFLNEVKSFDAGGGEVITQLEGNLETPTVAFDKTTTTTPTVLMAASLALSVADVKILTGINTVSGNAEASEGVKYNGNNHSVDWELDKILAAAETVKSDVSGTTKTIAGIGGNFNNTGTIKVSLALDGINGSILTSANTLSSSEIKGSDVEAIGYNRAGIQGNFSNDVFTLDKGSKNVIQKDVLDENGKPLYVLSDQAYNPNHNSGLVAVDAEAGSRLKSNVAVTNIEDKNHEDENNYEFGVGKDGTVEDGVVYDQAIWGGFMNNSLALDVVNVNALGLNTNTAGDIIEDEVKVVRMNNSHDVSSVPVHDGIASVADRELIVDVTSDTTTNLTSLAGIGGQFSNRSALGMTAALSLNVVTGTALATTVANIGNVHGGTSDINTLVVAGIGNAENATLRGLENRADSYNTTVHVGGKSKVASGDVNPVDGNSFHAVDANNAIIASNETDGNQTLALIDSKEVVYWDNKIVVGNIATSLALDTFNLDATSIGGLTVGNALAVTNEVNVSGELQDVAGFHVTGSSIGADVTKNTTAVAGVKGGFLNQGIIATVLSGGNVLDSAGLATGKLASDAVVGSSLTALTKTIVGVQGGGFTNEIVSLDTDGSEIVTRLDENGSQVAEVIFNRERTVAPLAAVLATNLSLDTVKLDVATKNTVTAPAIASEYVLSSATSGDALSDAKTAKSHVSGTTVSIGGIDGDFYNSGVITATLALNAITSKAASINTLAGGIINGGEYEANATAYSRINGNFVNDARLYDNDTSPTVNYFPVSDTNETLSNVARSVTYEQDVVQGLIGTTTAIAPLSLIASGGQTVTVDELGYTEVKVVDVSTDALALNADLNHTTTTERISSNVKAINQADAGIGGIFLNAGLLTTVASVGPAIVGLDALSTSSSVTVDKVGGGTLTALNIVTSGANVDKKSTKTFNDLLADNKYTHILPAGLDIKSFGTGENNNSIGFLNDKRDFNDVLETDSDYSEAKVAIGTIGSATLPVPVSMLSTGSATTDVTADSERLYTTDTDRESTYGTASISNVSDVKSVINGDFINLGSIATLTSPIATINMNAVNGLTGNKNDVHTITADLDADTGGLLQSSLVSRVGSYIDGDFINTGTIISPLAVLGISMGALGGTSTVKGTLDDKALTEWAGENGKVIASNLQITRSGAKNFFNSGTITHVLGTGVSLTATGAADSSGFTFTDTNLTKSANAVISNQVISDASLATFTNSGLIHANLGALNLSATGSAKRATDITDTNLASYEDTFARVNASVGDVRNLAYTRQHQLWEVDKAFNTDNNDTTDDQLHPNEERVARNNGEYDLTTGAKTVTDTTTFSTTEELEKLAVGVLNADNNTSSAILEQQSGTLTSLTKHVIGLSATATESNSTLVTATTGNIFNGGKISALAGVGIDIKADGDADNGAVAKATTGTIFNLVTHDTFAITDQNGEDTGDVVHSVLTAEISGLAAGIKLDAVDAGDKDVSVATVDKIINYRTVLHVGDKVIGSGSDENVTSIAGTGKVAANGNTVDTRADNYGVKTLEIDGIYTSEISGLGTGSSIIVGENAHVTNGIHNFGKLVGKVELGDADLHLYGLVQNADKNETYGQIKAIDGIDTANYFASTGPDINGTASAAYIDKIDTDFTQEAGTIVTTDPLVKVTDALVGSSINFHNSHILETVNAEYKADSILIHSDSIVNIGEDTKFTTNDVENPFDAERTNTVVNAGVLNVRAGTKLTVNGNYQGIDSRKDTRFTTDGSAESFAGHFVTNIKVANIKVDDNNTFDQAGGTYGQLNVTGNADLAGGIGVRIDDPSVNLYALTTTETRLKDVVISGTLSSGDSNLTHSGGNTQTALGVKVTDNVSAFDFQAVEGTDAGNVDLIVVARAVDTAAEGGLVIDTPRVAIETIRNFSSVIDTRIDMSSGYIGKLEGNSGAPVVHINGSGRKAEGTGRVGVEGNHEKGENAGTNANVQPSFFATTNYWVKPFAGLSQQDNVGDIAGYDTNTYGLAAGADKQYGEWFVGLATALAKSNASSTSGPSSSTETKLFQGTVYGSRKAGEGIINLQAGAGFLANDRTRLAEEEGSNVEADYDGYVIQAKAIYEQAAILNNDTLLIPYVSAELAHVENDGYTETGAKNAIQSVGSTSANAAILSVGTKAKYKLTDSSSIVGKVGVGYDFLAEEQDYTTTYVEAQQSAVLHGAKPEKLEYNVGLAYQVETGGGTQVKLGVDYTGRNGYDSAIGSARFYFPF